MKSRLFVLIAALGVAGCYQCPTMTCYRFDDITIGEEIAKVEDCFGRPYQVFCCSDGSKAHVYIERLYLGGGVDAQRHYILKVKNGIIVDRRVDYYEEPMDIVQFDEDWDWN